MTSLLMAWACKISLYHNGPELCSKLKQIDRFGDANCVRGLPAGNKIRLLFTWEKNVLNKTYVSWGSKHSLFEDFFCKRKENDLHKKYRLFGGLAENLSSPTISQIEQILWFYFIYKALEQSVTSGAF